jgi:hypothetical protein
MKERSYTQESISNLSFGLIENALSSLQREAYPVYLKNIERRDPPFAHGEFTPSGIAILLMMSGLDFHLARLKYLRDLTPHSPPLPYITYFNWKIGDPLSEKIQKLLFKRNERRLREHLIDMTVMRDSVAHPKLYLIREVIKSDLSIAKPKAKISAGAEHRAKARDRKLKRSERTRSLRLPLVPTWISYPDVVLCALVLNRFLSLLERRYGNPYAWVGSFSVRNDPANFFKDWGDRTRRSLPMNEWVKGLYNSLSNDDQLRLRKKLGSDVERYVSEHRRRVRIGKGRMSDILRAIQNPPRPEFLSKPPPWAM